jgi:microcystin-dependent protein
MDPFVAEVRIFGFNFPPSGWAFCNGQTLPISQNTALFSLVGTFYGGDGRSTFALPNLQGRFALGQGSGPGLSPRVVGEAGGAETVTLTSAQMAQHSHSLQGTNIVADSGSPAGNLLGASVAAPTYRVPVNTVAMAAESLAPAGAGQPHNNLSPFVGLNFCIALQGVFPPRG